MQDEMARLAELRLQGFHCSQMLLILGLERQGKVNPDIVRAMAGLANGLGDSGRLCGVLSGAVCLIGLYAGRGSLEEKEHSRLNLMIQSLVSWFEEKFGALYGGIDCHTILNGDPWNKMLRCPNLTMETYVKVLEILEENDVFAPQSDRKN